MARNIKLGEGQLVYTDAGGNSVLVSGDLGSGLVGTILKTPNGINQLIIGLLPDGSYGLVISKPNVDVLTLFS